MKAYKVGIIRPNPLMESDGFPNLPYLQTFIVIASSIEAALGRVRGMGEVRFINVDTTEVLLATEALRG